MVKAENSENRMKTASSRILIATSICTGFAAVAGLMFVYFGVYNVSALAQHTVPVYNMLQIALNRSIAVRSGKIQVPELADVNTLEGLRLYAENCQQCHGAPGVGPTSFSLGMLPAPTAVAKIALDRSPAEIFWSVKNGIKMTGMPAWDYRFDDHQIWQIVAAVEMIDQLTVDEYLALRSQALDTPVDGGSLVDRDTAAADSSPEKTDPVNRGRLALQQYNCSSCHEIPGVVAARNQVGPPLGNVTERAFVAGVLPNTDENLVRWIRFPREIAPDTTMPNLNVSEAHAWQMVAYFRSISEPAEALQHPPPGERPRD